jgi:hypothetical protein
MDFIHDDLGMRESDEKTKIVVGVGTCTDTFRFLVDSDLTTISSKISLATPYIEARSAWPILEQNPADFSKPHRFF